MELTTIAADGLRVSTQATLAQLATAEPLDQFANGLIPTALGQTSFAGTLVEALHHTQASVYGLLTALLALDAEVETMALKKRRTFPLPTFLSYRANLPPDQFPPTTLRLPPLNPDGHYLFHAPTETTYGVVRLDLHPGLRIMGHVRLAVSGPTCSPRRLTAVEHRLERQTLTPTLIQAALEEVEAVLSPPFAAVVQRMIGDSLQELSG